MDHFAGLSVLLQRFPDARAIATPKLVELMRKQTGRLPFYRKLLPGQLPATIALPEPYDDGGFTLEGHQLRIIEQGRNDAVDTTSPHVPSIDLVVPEQVSPQTPAGWNATAANNPGAVPSVRSDLSPDSPPALAGRAFRSPGALREPQRGWP
jgi:hypothetical protein